RPRRAVTCRLLETNRWSGGGSAATMRRMAKLARFENAEALSRYRQAYEKTAASAAVPIRVHDVPTTFGSTHVIEAGEEDKPPLVLLHAMCFSSTAWVRSLASLS